MVEDEVHDRDSTAVRAESDTRLGLIPKYSS